MNFKLSIVNYQLSIILLIALFFVLPVKAQVNIGSTNPPEPFSILELTTDAKDGGLRLPQLNTEQRETLWKTHDDSIAAKGLVIYNTDIGCVEFWNGSKWISLCSDMLPKFEVDPESLNFAYDVTTGKDVTVTTSLTDWSWDISGTNDDDFSVTQSGNTLTVAPKTTNNANTPRIATITVTAGSQTKTVSIEQYVNIDNITSGTLLNPTYVGAFWRASQTGERIIRIPVPAAAAGAWTVYTGWVDSRWDGSGIVFSAAGTADNGVTFAAGETPDDAENYKITDGSLTVGGTVASGDMIKFRIGLNKAFDDSSVPARYAVLLLSYANGTQIQKIYIRQGDKPDYVMRPEDGINVSGGSSGGGLIHSDGPGARPSAVKYAAYNIKDPNNNESTTVGDSKAILGPNGGKFVDFPTQAGYMFVWNYSRQAFAPNLGVISNGSIINTYNGNWDTNPVETCPSGFRRPGDGPQDSDAGAVNGSEIRQSLFTTPPIGGGNTSNNSVSGYYADGFFDRRQIVTDPTGNNASSAVSTGNNEVAYKGRLIYNPTTNASLFFPFAGAFTYSASLNSLNLLNSGSLGYYWTSTTRSNVTTAWNLLVNNNALQSSYVANNVALSIRCVKDVN